MPDPNNALETTLRDLRAIVGRPLSKSEMTLMRACLINFNNRSESEALAVFDELVAPDPSKSLVQRIRDEFADFQMLVEHCSKIYYHVTDGQISKPNTIPEAVIRVAEDLESERIRAALEEAADELAQLLQSEILND